MIRGPMSKNGANENRPRCVRTGRMVFILAAARKDSEKRGQSIRCARGKLRRQHAADPKRPIRRTARCFRSKDRSGGGKTPEFLSSASRPGNLRARSVCRNRFSPVSRLAEAEPMFGFAPGLSRRFGLPDCGAVVVSRRDGRSGDEIETACRHGRTKGRYRVSDL